MLGETWAGLVCIQGTLVHLEVRKSCRGMACDVRVGLAKNGCPSILQGI